MRNEFSSSGFIIAVRTTSKCVLLAGLALMSIALVIPAESSFAQTQQLPINVFVAAQPPTQALCWEETANGNILCFDLLGNRNALFNLNLGTSISGGVTIRDLQNGLQAVSVEVITTDAVCWGFDANGDPAFGQRPLEIADGAKASLGNGLTTLDFTQPAGAPMPTIGEIVTSLNGTILLSARTSIMCAHGELRPSGAPGFAQTTQTVLLNTGVPGGCPPEQDADCAPAEKVQFKPTGR